jgi:hypothetical protein
MVMATNTQSKGQVVSVARQLIAGTGKHLATGTQASFAGGTFTPDQIANELQSIVDLRADVRAAQASARAKVAAETARMPSLRTFMSAYLAFIKVTYGTAPDVLADFGIHPKARVPLTVEAKALAVARRKATRAARHTMGAKQKLAIKGDVTGIVLTPVTAEPSTVVAPSSATSRSAPATSAK